MMSFYFSITDVKSDAHLNELTFTIYSSIKKSRGDMFHYLNSALISVMHAHTPQVLHCTVTVLRG
jgi:hypothetical protein